MLGQRKHRTAVRSMAAGIKERQMQCARAHIELEKELQYLKLLRSANKVARQNPFYSVVQDVATARTVFAIRCHRFTIDQLENKPACFGCRQVNGRLYRYDLKVTLLPNLAATPVDLCIECAAKLQASLDFHLYEPDPRD